MEAEIINCRLGHDGYDESPLESIADDLPALLGELAGFVLETHRAIQRTK